MEQTDFRGKGCKQIVKDPDESILELFESLFEHAVSTQLRRNFWDGVIQPKPLYCE
jgi:hypothetical protein